MSRLLVLILITRILIWLLGTDGGQGIHVISYSLNGLCQVRAGSGYLWTGLAQFQVNAHIAHRDLELRGLRKPSPPPPITLSFVNLH